MNTDVVLNRRSFLAGAAALAGSSALAGIASAAEDSTPATESFAESVTETVDVDVVVVGSGVSGMAAGVQAAELGLKTLVIEASDIRGAVIRSTEGLAAVNSNLQQEQGIEISIPEVVKTESEAVQYRLNGLFWKELLERSGETIQWLADNGVSFTGAIDDYNGTGTFPTFHWFPGDHEAQTYYGDPMEATFKSYESAELRLKTRGRELKMVNGAVAGLYATTENGVLEINAPVVILATGGFGANLDEVARHFSKLPVGRYSCDGASTNVGDGTNMAISAGGVLDTMHTCFLGTTIGDVVNSAFAMNAINTNTVWVNQDGQRFTDESVGGILSIPGVNLLFHHDEIYALYDAALLGDDKIADAREEAADNPTGVLSGNTIEELAQAMGVDPEVLAKTVENYNAAVASGVDADFGKDLTGAAAITEAPFFAFRQKLSAHGNIGGLLVNLNYEVIKGDSTPIAGLYAVGTESNMNYREFAYNFTVPGGAMSQAVDSGRWAAKNAAQYLQA